MKLTNENPKKLLSFCNKSSIILASFSKEIFRKGGLKIMTTADLIWHLIELLLKDKETKSNDNEKTKKD